MREHFERGHIINVKIVADEDPFDGERRAYLRGLFIEREAGRPWAYEARARPGARQRFAFDTRFVDFAELLYALGLPALGVCEPLGVEAIRAEAPSRNNVPPILGFRSPCTGKEWRPSAAAEKLEALEKRNKRQAERICELGREFAVADATERCEHHFGKRGAAGRRLVAAGVDWAAGVPAAKERAECWYLARRRLAEAMLQLKHDAVEAGPPDPVAVLGDVAAAIAARGLDAEVIATLNKKAFRDAEQRSQATQAGVPDKGLTGQRYRIDVSVSDGNPVEVVGGALWSCMDLAMELGLGPEDIKRPLLQALAIFGHNVEITTRGKPSWPNEAPVPSYGQGGLFFGGPRQMAFNRVDESQPPKDPLRVTLRGDWQPLQQDMANWYAMGGSAKFPGLVYLLRTNGQRQEAAIVGSVDLAPCATIGAAPAYPFNPATGELPRHGEWEPCEVERERRSPQIVVCDTCKDTHQMELGEQGKVPCTRCPTPCPSCAENGGRGAYCESTPCDCSCHEMGT